MKGLSTMVNNHKKRILSFLLTVALVLTLLPVTAVEVRATDDSLAEAITIADTNAFGTNGAKVTETSTALSTATEKKEALDTIHTAVKNADTSGETTASAKINTAIKNQGSNKTAFDEAITTINTNNTAAGTGATSVIAAADSDATETNITDLDGVASYINEKGDGYTSSSAAWTAFKGHYNSVTKNYTTAQALDANFADVTTAIGEEKNAVEMVEAAEGAVDTANDTITTNVATVATKLQAVKNAETATAATTAANEANTAYTAATGAPAGYTTAMANAETAIAALNGDGNASQAWATTTYETLRATVSGHTSTLDAAGGNNTLASKLATAFTNITTQNTAAKSAEDNADTCLTNAQAAAGASEAATTVTAAQTEYNTITGELTNAESQKTNAENAKTSAETAFGDMKDTSCTATTTASGLVSGIDTYITGIESDIDAIKTLQTAAQEKISELSGDMITLGATDLVKGQGMTVITRNRTGQTITIGTGSGNDNVLSITEITAGTADGSTGKYYVTGAGLGTDKIKITWNDGGDRVVLSESINVYELVSSDTNTLTLSAETGRYSEDLYMASNVSGGDALFQGSNTLTLTKSNAGTSISADDTVLKWSLVDSSDSAYVSVTQKNGVATVKALKAKKTQENGKDTKVNETVPVKAVYAYTSGDEEKIATFYTDVTIIDLAMGLTATVDNKEATSLSMVKSEETVVTVTIEGKYESSAKTYQDYNLKAVSNNESMVAQKGNNNPTTDNESEYGVTLEALSKGSTEVAFNVEKTFSDEGGINGKQNLGTLSIPVTVTDPTVTLQEDVIYLPAKDTGSIVVKSNESKKDITWSDPKSLFTVVNDESGYGAKLTAKNTAGATTITGSFVGATGTVASVDAQIFTLTASGTALTETSTAGVYDLDMAYIENVCAETNNLTLSNGSNLTKNTNTTWKSSDTKVVTVVDGTLTAIAPGTATVEATYKLDKTITLKVNVTVNDLAVSVTHGKISITKTGTYDLSPVVTYNGGKIDVAAARAKAHDYDATKEDPDETYRTKDEQFIVEHLAYALTATTGDSNDLTLGTKSVEIDSTNGTNVTVNTITAPNAVEASPYNPYTVTLKASFTGIAALSASEIVSTVDFRVTVIDSSGLSFQDTSYVTGRTKELYISKTGGAQTVRIKNDGGVTLGITETDVDEVIDVSESNNVITITPEKVAAVGDATIEVGDKSLATDTNALTISVHVIGFDNTAINYDTKTGAYSTDLYVVNRTTTAKTFAIEGSLPTYIATQGTVVKEWASKKEAVAKVTNETTGEVTAVDEGSSEITGTVTITKFLGEESDPETDTVWTVSVTGTANVYDRGDVKLDDFDDINLALGGTTIFRPSTTPGYDDVTYAYEKKSTVTTTTTGNAVIETTGSHSPEAALVKAHSSVDTTEYTVSAILDNVNNGADIVLDSATLTIRSISSGNILKTGATTLNVTTNFVVTNSSKGYYDTNPTLASLSEDAEIFNDGWRFEDPSTKLSTFAGKTTATVPVVYEETASGKVVYSTEGELTLNIATLQGITSTAPENLNLVYSETSAKYVVSPVFTDSSIVADNFPHPVGVVDIEGKSSKSSVADVTLDKDGKSFTVTADKANAGSTKVTITLAGFSTAINVTNAENYATFTNVSIDSPAKTAVDGEGTNYTYYIESEDVNGTLGLMATVKNAKTVKISSSNTGVATVSAMTGTGTFTSSITVKGTGYTVLTLTSDDSVKTACTIGFYVTEPRATINDLSLDSNVDYTLNSVDDNIINYLFTGCGFDLADSATAISLDAGAADSKYFTVTRDAGKNFRLYPNTGANKPADGTYTLTFVLDAESSLAAALSVPNYKVADVKVQIAAKSLKDSEFKATQSGTYNAFYRKSYNTNWDGWEDNVATVIISGKTVEAGKVKLESGSSYELVYWDDEADSYVATTKYVEPDENGEVYVRIKSDINTEAGLKDAVKSNARKLVFSVLPAGYAETATAKTAKLTLKVANKAPKFTASSKSATIYSNLETGLTVWTTLSTKSDGAEITAANYNIDFVDKNGSSQLQANGGKYQIVLNNGSVAITAVDKTAPAVKGGKIVLTKNAAGWTAANYKATVAYSINVTTTKKAVLKPDKTTITLNNANADEYGDEKATVHVGINGGTDMSAAQALTVKVTGANTKSEEIRSRDGKKYGVSITEGVDDVVFTLDKYVKKGSYKFNISAKIAGQTVTKAVTLKVVDTAKGSAVKFSKKGKVDILNWNEGITLTPKITGYNGEMVNIEVGTGDGSHFDINEDVDSQTISIRRKYGESYSTKVTYSVDITIVLDNGIKVKANKPITFKVTQGKVSATVNPTMPQISAGNFGYVNVFAYHKVAGQKSLAHNDVAAQTGAATTAYIKQVSGDKNVTVSVAAGSLVTDLDTFLDYGKIKITPTNVKKGKTYSVKLEVHQVGEATNLKPATVTLKVKVPK